MSVRLPVFWALGGSGLLFFGAGCGGRTENKPPLSQLQSMASDITTLEFTRTTTGQSNPPAPLHVVVSDTVEAQALYRLTLALPELLGPASECPADMSVHYHLTFLSGTSVVLEAVEEPDGCQRVAVGGLAQPLVGGNAYWARLSLGLGVPESIMYPEASLH